MPAGPRTPGDDLINCRDGKGRLGDGRCTTPTWAQAALRRLCSERFVSWPMAIRCGVFTMSRSARLFPAKLPVKSRSSTMTKPRRTYRKMINRIDLCKSAKETTPCNNESATPLTTAFTPNNSGPHGIRWSKLTKKIYSIQEGYGEIAEIDPATLAITKTFDLAGTPYTAFGISPDGRFLLLRGDTTPPTGTKLGVIDLGTAATPTDGFHHPRA